MANLLCVSLILLRLFYCPISQMLHSTVDILMTCLYSCRIHKLSMIHLPTCCLSLACSEPFRCTYGWLKGYHPPPQCRNLQWACSLSLNWNICPKSVKLKYAFRQIFILHKQDTSRNTSTLCHLICVLQSTMDP